MGVTTKIVLISNILSFYRSSKAWAVMIQQVWEVDPLTCVNCGGKMKLIAFISRNQKEIIHALTDGLNVEMPDLEEIARGPPRWCAIQEALQFIQAHPDAYPEEDLDQTAHINEEDYFVNSP